MKRIIITLLMVLLAFGFAFAATGDSKNATSGDSFVVYTIIKPVYPVYEIVGSNGQTAGITATSKTASRDIIEGKLSADGDYISITTTLYHFGKIDNDMDKGKTNIRYKGVVHVQIEAKELNLETDGSISGKTITDTTDHVLQSDLPIASSQNYSVTTLNYFTSAEDTSVTAADNKLNVLATYTNGMKVETGTESKAVASCIFTWDISELTAGDTYKADVIVTYTVE